MRELKMLWLLSAFMAVALLVGCEGSAEPTPAVAEETSPSELSFAVKDPAEPFAVDEKGTITLTNDQAYDIRVQRETGDPLFVLSFKKSGVIDPSVRFTVQTTSFDVPDELSESYVAVSERAFELHAADEQGYGFALRPELKIHFTEEQIAAAQQEGATVDPLEGNLIVLYKEQRSPKWVPQTSVSIGQDNNVVTVSNVAGAGAWALVARTGS
jgi:hypothetical protein